MDALEGVWLTLRRLASLARCLHTVLRSAEFVPRFGQSERKPVSKLRQKEVTGIA